MHEHDLFVARYINSLGRGKELSINNLDSLLRVGLNLRPVNANSTASSFSSWVFDLSMYGCPMRTPAEQDDAFRIGKDGEKYLKARYAVKNKLQPGCTAVSEWELFYEDKNSESQEPLYSSLLTYKGEKLRCKPDLVLKHRKTGAIQIIETKVVQEKRYLDGRGIPHHGWPNLVAQLWCYSWIDDFMDMPNVILTGSIHHSYGSEPIKYAPAGVTPRTQRNDPLFNKQCSQLFLHFDGKINSKIFEKHQSVGSDAKRILKTATRPYAR